MEDMKTIGIILFILGLVDMVITTILTNLFVKLGATEQMIYILGWSLWLDLVMVCAGIGLIFVKKRTK